MTLNKQNKGKNMNIVEKLEKRNQERMNRFDYVIDQATSDKDMNAKEMVTFHHLNPNGLLTQLRDIGNKAYDNYRLASGLFATDYYDKEFSKLCRQNNPRYNNILTLIQMMERDIEMYQDKINKRKK